MDDREPLVRDHVGTLQGVAVPIVRVLYLNHTAYFGGAERSLLELLSGPPDGILPLVLAPRGPLLDQARAAGIDVLPVPAADGGLRLHVRHTPLTLLALARAARAVRRAAHDFGADLVHANTVRAG